MASIIRILNADRRPQGAAVVTAILSDRFIIVRAGDRYMPARNETGYSLAEGRGVGLRHTSGGVVADKLLDFDDATPVDATVDA